MRLHAVHIVPACAALLLAGSALAAAPAVAFKGKGLSFTAISNKGRLVTLHAARDACAAMAPAGSWRLPTMKEVQAFWKEGKSTNELEQALFPESNFTRVWTSDRFEDMGPGLGWAEGLNRSTAASRRTEAAYVTCVAGKLDGGQPGPVVAAKPAASAPASAGKAVAPKLTLQGSPDGLKENQKHVEKVQKEMAASSARAKAEQAEADRRFAAEQKAARDQAAANRKPCPSGQSCNTSR